MKKIFTLVLVAGSTLNVLAQSPVVVSDHEGNVVNGGSVMAWGPPGTFELSVSLKTESDESFNQIVNVKRYEMDVVGGTKNMFCWGVCYNPTDAGVLPLWVSDDVVNMDPDSVYESFHAYYRPNGLEGASWFRYIWYSTSDPNDSTFVDVYFNTVTGIEENAGTANTFQVYPNPVLDGTVTLEHLFTSPGATGEVVVHDLLGNEVMRKTISARVTTARISTAGLEPGVYFFSLQQNGSAVATQRVVVAR
jgi:hypothetical protein